VVSAFAFHKGAHFAAGQLTGTHLDWSVGTLNQPIEFSENTKDDSDGLIVYSAGLAAQVASSELILNVDSIDKNDAFVRGMMAWNIFNPITYAFLQDFAAPNSSSTRRTSARHQVPLGFLAAHWQAPMRLAAMMLSRMSERRFCSASRSMSPRVWLKQ
jgi:hypothetical protein